MEDAEQLGLGSDFWERLAAGETVSMRALGRSMMPFFPSGTVFLVRRAAADEVRLGELVLAQFRGRVRLHRVIGFRDGAPLTKGDWRSDVDPEWPKESVVGRVVDCFGGAPGWTYQRGAWPSGWLAKLSPWAGRLLGGLRRLRHGAAAGG